MNSLTTLTASEPDCRVSLEPFWRALQEAIAWCQPRANVLDPPGCFRDETLRPPTLSRIYASAVSTVLAWRRAATRPQSSTELSLAGGRLLVYFPDADLCDGAAQLESKGFLDVHNCPPWGTWVGFFSDQDGSEDSCSSYLVAWIPREFLKLVSAGIDVNPEECIVSVDQTQVALRPLLTDAP